MADAITNITIYHNRGVTPATIASRYILDASQRVLAVSRMAETLSAIAGGVEGGAVEVRVDSATGVAAAGTIALSQADATAGDKLICSVPGGQTFVFTGVEGTATAASGQYSIDTDDTAVAVSLKAAINAVSGIRDIMSADNSTGTLTWTAKRIGTWGNGIIWRKEVTTAGAATITDATNGRDITAKPSITLLFGAADIVANDTISIGAREYTWKAAASADGEITLSTTPATAAANFLAAFNADATWTGLATATLDTATVTITWQGDPRFGRHMVVVLTETNATSITVGGTALTSVAESLSLTTTITGSSARKQYLFGAI